MCGRVGRSLTVSVVFWLVIYLVCRAPEGWGSSGVSGILVRAPEGEGSSGVNGILVRAPEGKGSSGVNGKSCCNQGLGKGRIQNCTDYSNTVFKGTVSFNFIQVIIMGKASRCSRCGRPRKGHPLPIGPNCTEPLLTEDELAGLDSTDSGDEEFEDADAMLEELQKKKEALAAQQKQADEELQAQEKQAADRAKAQQIRELQQEVDRMTISLDETRKRLDGLKNGDAGEGDGNPPPGPIPKKSVPAAPGGKDALAAAADRAAMPPPPSPGLGLLDPSLTLYAQAVAQAQAAATATSPGAIGPAPPPGLQAQQLLAAACGINSASRSTANAGGKLNPEKYIFKNKIVTDRDRERVTYYDFVYGVFRLLKHRLLDEHKPVDDLIIYYEQISGFARKYKWHAVHALHLEMMDEIEDDRRQWSDKIEFSTCFNHLNADNIVTQNERRPRSTVGHRDRRDHDGSGSRDRGQSKGGDFKKEKVGTCNEYNDHPGGCDFGRHCRFNHHCSKCDEKGVKAIHPAMYCKGAGSQK